MPQAASEDRQGDNYLLWDAELLPRAHPEHFDPQWWRTRERLRGHAQGRGAVAFVAVDNGEWVLRHYRRGGLVARLVTDRYCWLGAERGRAFREWRLLAHMRRQGLPVPAPVAARLERAGPSYRADLITTAVPDATTLYQRLLQAPLAAGEWQALGALIARFHAAGVCHHDLNAHNILIDGAGRFTLIDFDKGRVRNPGRWQEANRTRLRRSLDKLHEQSAVLHFREPDWQALLGGYLQARR